MTGANGPLLTTRFPLFMLAKSMAERGDALYLVTKTNLLKSTDQGVTWDILGKRPNGYVVAHAHHRPNANVPCTGYPH